MRKEFGLKRREIAYSCEQGNASIRTPEFEIELNIDQDPNNLKHYQITTSIRLLGDYDAAADDRFSFCFNVYVDQLLIQFTQSIDIEDAIDRIEDIPHAADALDYAPDGSRLSLNFEQQDLFIEVTETQASFQLQRSRNLQILLQKSQEAFDILAAVQLNPSLDS